MQQGLDFGAHCYRELSINCNELADHYTGTGVYTGSSVECPTGKATAVAEPSSFLLAAMVAVALLTVGWCPGRRAA